MTEPWLLPHCHNCEAFNVALEPYRGRLWCGSCRAGHEELLAWKASRTMQPSIAPEGATEK